MHMTRLKEEIGLIAPSTTVGSGVLIDEKKENLAVSKSRDPYVLGILREFGVYVALALVLFIVTAIAMYLGKSQPLTAANLSNIVYQASLTGIMAIAMTVVLITGNFDLSVGSVAALVGVVFLMTVGTLGFGIAAILALSVAAFVGLVNGAINQFLGINAFIVTLGMLTGARGIILVLTDGRSLNSTDESAVAAMQLFETTRQPMNVVLYCVGGLFAICGLVGLYRGSTSRVRGVFALIGATIVGGMGILSGPRDTVANPAIYFLVFTVVIWLLLTFTTFGRRLYAVGGNAEAARLAGVNVVGYKIFGFLLSSLAAGFAGLLYVSRLGSTYPGAMQGAELAVIASAILGGTSLFGGSGSVLKSAAGALLLVTLTNGFNLLNLGANYQGIIEGVVIIVAAAIYTVGAGRRR
ncbi:putative permease component of ABC transporter [Mesorhizobium plurifarium]|uniref:Putative permease component of ABC transporter n=1 Tax=Mesorhizobium plurifarium TaxID=69974 RepID=A0A090EUV9_MESPL|nr:putative permease component of ABC transporter [Mesorhizobium sp. SOD10]CDX35380.1 putative permease component of ABC transporter [Mesorhizobium plurifarium]